MRDELSLLKEIGAGKETPVLLEQEARRALLAVIAREQRFTSVRRIRRPLLLGLAFGVAICALLVGVLARGDSPSVAARAYAAISPPSGIMHFVLQCGEGYGGCADPGQGGAKYEEYWIDIAHPRRQRIVMSLRGRVVAQYVLVTHYVPGGGTRWSRNPDTEIMANGPGEGSTPVDGPQGWGAGGVEIGQNPMAAYRNLLQHATVLSQQQTTYEGRDAYELHVQFTPPYDLVGNVWPGDQLTYIVDRHTYYPLESAFKLDYAKGGNMASTVTRFPLFEILSDTPQNRALLQPEENPLPFPR